MSDLDAFLRSLEHEPHRHDFFMAMRRLDCFHADKPRLGRGFKPSDEPVRLGQDVSMSFAPAPIARFIPAADGRPARLSQRFFGLFGPNGPLPLHLTDYARERELHHGDRTLSRFCDLFHHRMLGLFYRAWAQAQPTVSLDRPREDRHADFIGSLIGIGIPPLHRRDEAGDRVKLFHAGLFAQQVRNADGLRALLTSFFRVPVRIESFVGHWMQLPPSDRTRLGVDGPSSRVGIGLVIGRRVWDRQHRFRIHVGAVDFASYEDFLPGGTALPKVVALVRQYFCFELDWDLRLALRQDQQPALKLDRTCRLGWTTWLGRRRSGADLNDLVLDAEAVLARKTVPFMTSENKP